MAITQAMCTSFKKELLEGQHDFRSAGDTFKLALYSAAATLSAGTTNFTTSGEVEGAGYSSGGIELTNVDPTNSGTVGITNFGTATFTAVSITARGGLIYNTTADNSSGTTNSVAVIDFSADKTAVVGNFTVTFPTADGTTAIIRTE